VEWERSCDEENLISTAVVNGFVEENDVTKHKDPRFGTFEELPDELATLRGQIFENQSDLLDAIDELGCQLERVCVRGAQHFYQPSNSNRPTTPKAVQTSATRCIILGISQM
jgi:hypothetical protein